VLSDGVQSVSFGIPGLRQWPVPFWRLAVSDDSVIESSNKPDPNEKLVKVFDSEQESEVMIVKGLLDASGIDNDMTSVDVVQEMFPGLGGMVILVREEDAETARRLIEDSRKAAPAVDETAEFDISGNKPA
jgi:hypothetical protein